MNKISYREIKNRNKSKLALKGSSKDNKLQKHLKINNFNIIELNEEEITPEFEPNINNLSEREIQRLKKKASSIEEYYSSKSEDINIKENCFNCLMSNFKPNELLYFSKRKDLLAYLKYCFYFLKNILFLDNQIYIENKYDLEKCDANYINGWKFFIPKTVCRGCFLQIINTEHLFGNLKTIFTDVDPHTVSKSMFRNRSHYNSRVRNTRSMRRHSIPRNLDANENGENEKNKITVDEKESNDNKIKIKNIKYNSKNNNNISYDDKNRLISIKKDILGGEVGSLINKKEENKKLKKNNKNNAEFTNESNNQNDEQSVTEIKIKANEFVGEGNTADNHDKKEKNIKENIINKNKESIIKDENKINKKNVNNKSDNNNDSNIKSNNSSSNNNNSSINEILINNTNKKNNDNNSKEEKSINNLNKNKKNMNIFNEILNIKLMTNRIVIKLHYKLNAFKDTLLYIIINIGDFKEKLLNSMNFNPDVISYGINQYEQYFSSLYDEGFKAKKEYEEMFTKIKNESIPSISRNILKLKEQEKLDDDDKKNLDEMENCLKDYSEKIDDMEKRYEDSINNFFSNFRYFFQLIKELKIAFAGQIY